ncbi:hypothetical protein C8Q75DRAFT_807550 [Abortiporus biennis]|nr:hypothetical protein C8Q75DRAFT_807550 [Abortiporus biennis]
MESYSEQDDFYQHHSQSNRPHSIDFSLELERELAIESPTSPNFPPDKSRPQSLDPHVLASLVTQLRSSLAEVTKERDDLATMLAESQSCESSLKDTLHAVSEKSARLETELNNALDKNKDDADAIAMLRSKLEDSRRALMRLQTENRRASANFTLDLSRAAQLPYNSGPPSSKRASFTPLTGSPASRNGAHRRIVSVSEPGVMNTPNYGDNPSWIGSPESIRSAPQTSNSNRRMSGFFGRSQPLFDQSMSSSDSGEAEDLKKELQKARDQLEETKHELSEAQEAYEASETCVKALRTFIAENSIGLNPNVQSSTPSPAPTHSNSPSLSKWGFKLWKTETPAVSPLPQENSPALPARSKIGGFFASRTSSVSTLPEPRSQPRPRSQESACGESVSTLSDDLPISPTFEQGRPEMVKVVEVEETSMLSLAYLPAGKEDVVGLGQFTSPSSMTAAP